MSNVKKTNMDGWVGWISPLQKNRLYLYSNNNSDNNNNNNNNDDDEDDDDDVKCHNDNRQS